MKGSQHITLKFTIIYVIVAYISMVYKDLPSTSVSSFHKSEMQLSKFRLKARVSLFCITYKIKTYILMLCTRLILMELFDHESKNVYFYRPWPVWISELENTMRTALL